MGYYSTMYVFPQNIVTTDKEKIRQFNEIAEYIQGERENLDPELKPIYEKVTEYADESDKEYFFYRLNEDGELAVQKIEEGNTELSIVSKEKGNYGKHYAAEMLAKLLVEYAEYPMVIEFISEDAHWGYCAEPKKDYYYLEGLLVQSIAPHNHKIRIHLTTGFQEYALIEKPLKGGKKWDTIQR